MPTQLNQNITDAANLLFVSTLENDDSTVTVEVYTIATGIRRSILIGKDDLQNLRTHLNTAKDNLP